MDKFKMFVLEHYRNIRYVMRFVRLWKVVKRL